MQSTRDCDALIVGGGPAGSTCAWQLTQAGFHVVLLDKATFPRDKPCAGWITPPVVEALQLDVEEYREVSRVWQTIDGFRCGVIGQPSVEVRYTQPISYGIRRREFDDYLLQRSGAELIHERVASIERRQALWEINGRFRTKLLIGAGGNFCPVAKWLNEQVGSSRASQVVLAQEIEIPIPAGQDQRVAVDPRVPELFFCKDLQGYGWCFRKQGFLNIGLGRVGERKLSEQVQEFRGYLKATGRVEIDIPERFLGHAYRLYDSRQIEPVGAGVLLLGDSAGLAYALSGEGIRPAVESGLLAAQTIVDADGDYSLARLQSYGECIRERFGSTDSSSWWNVLPAGWLTGMARPLFRSRWFSRQVVMDRWFLRTTEKAIQTCR